MTKELWFDLNFEADGKIHPVSSAGREFLNSTQVISVRQIYQTAVEQGLHVRFATIHLRDIIAAN